MKEVATIGIPKFYGWLAQNELFRQTIHDRLPSEADTLLIDVNGIIHGNAQKVFQYGGSTPGTRGRRNVPVQTVGGQIVVSQAEMYKRRFEIYQGVFNDIIRLTRLIGPKKSLILAVDGVPPEAKCMQQRGRRFASAADRPMDQPFDSNSINPGTDFMFELDQYIREQLEQLINMDRESTRVPHPHAGVLPPYVMYSSHLVPGEGEHKIADHMRSVQAKGQTAVVYGTDADLIMIYLLHLDAGWKNIYLFRESEFRGRPQIGVIDLSMMAGIIRKLYPGAIAPLDDFVTLLLLNGNDFLPHFPVFERVWDAVQTLIFGYRAFLDANPGKGICISDTINWENFGLFCDFVSETWGNILLTAWAQNADNLIRFPSIVAERCTTQIRRIQSGTTTCVKEFDPEKFRDAWYQYTFSPKTGVGVIIPTDEDKSNLIKNYLEGIIWVHHYYKYGVSRLNVGWYYPWHYSPVFADLGPYIRSHPVDWENEPIFLLSDFISPLEQMLQVMPPRSLSVIPEPLRRLYTEASPIYDLYPESFVVDTGGKQEEWQGVPILPFPEPLRVHWALDMLSLPSTYTEQYEADENLVLIKDINQVYRSANPRGRGRGRGRGDGRGRGGQRGGYQRVQMKGK